VRAKATMSAPAKSCDMTSSTAADSRFPGYAGEVRLTPAGAGTHINWPLSSTASFPLVKAPLKVISQVLLRLLARAAVKAHRG
jgi:hypothetical protein